MLLLRRLALIGLALFAACRLEDHTPAGSRRDEAQIREVIIEYYRGLSARDWATCRKFFAPGGMVSYPDAKGGDSAVKAVIIPADSLFLTWAKMSSEGASAAGQARVIRADLRQSDGIAAVWVTLRHNIAYGRGEEVKEEIEQVEHFVLQRTGDGWRVVLLTLPRTPR